MWIRKLICGLFGHTYMVVNITGMKARTESRYVETLECVRCKNQVYRHTTITIYDGKQESEVK